MNDHVIIDRERVFQLSPAFALNSLQFELLGEPWPPKNGWIKRITGKQVSPETWERLISLSDKRFAKKERAKAKYEKRIATPDLFS